jgi:hypothetical protein
MATGSPGTNGVWLYGEDDSEATFSALLNKAGTTVNTQLGADRTRLTSLEGTRPGTVGQPFRQAAGTIANSNTGGGAASGWFFTTATTVTFPSGRFNAVPIVQANMVAGVVTTTYILTASTTGFTFGVARLGDYAGGLPVNWNAVQMTATTGNG